MSDHQTTRDNFITGYLMRSGIPNAKRTSNGFLLNNRRYWAIRCECGAEDCGGWSMIGASSLGHHMAFNAPDGEPWPDGAMTAHKVAWGDDADLMMDGPRSVTHV